MKSFFAILAGFVLLAPAVLASPAAFPDGGDDGHGNPPPKCLNMGEQCGDDKQCCAGLVCREMDGGHDGHGKGGGKPTVCCEDGKGGNGHW
ncbi:hypothetical protein FRC11_007084 [Ceratobasidium sp. 423]|nr:hypothetical protein FRC11_007084 [Ceratobasidium sp. 423]